MSENHEIKIENNDENYNNEYSDDLDAEQILDEILNYFRNEKIFYTIESGFGAAGGPIILKNRNYNRILSNRTALLIPGKKY